MIIRIEMFKFKSRQGRIALGYLREHVASLARLKGCLDAHVARSPEDPDHYLVYSRWDGLESHGAMAHYLRRNPEARRPLLGLVPLCDGDPRTGHFEVLEG